MRRMIELTRIVLGDVIIFVYVKILLDNSSVVGILLVFTNFEEEEFF